MTSAYEFIASKEYNERKARAKERARARATARARAIDISSYNNITSRTPFWSFTWNKQYTDSILEVSVHMPFIDAHQYHPNFSVMGIRFSTTNYDTNGSDIYGYFHHVDQDQSGQNNLASAYTGQMVYDTASTNISAAGTVYVRMVLNSNSGSAHGGLGEWNYNGDNRQMVTPISTVIIKEYEQ